MKEIISINIGQAGVQISNAIWELMCLEHGIDCDGQSNSMELSKSQHRADCIFMEISGNKFVPRCLTIDLEPTVIDEIRTGMYRHLFSASQLISGFEDSASNYARGHYTIGKLYLHEFMNTLRRIVHLCDSIQGFVVVQSFGGGCGSGFTSLIVEQLSIEYSKISKIQFSIVPSSNLISAIVEPYNSILAGKTCTEITDLCFQHDNQSMNKVIENRLSICNPTFTNINRLLAQLYSSLTISMRHENALNNDLNQMETNLIPYPKLHYPINIYSPLCTDESKAHYLRSTTQITRDIFSFSNKLLDCDFADGKFLSCCLQYRGNVYPNEVNYAISEIKKLQSVKFVDWCPTGYKIGINKQPTISPKNSKLFNTEKSLLLLGNNTCFHQKINQFNLAFDFLYRKRSFIHWFVSEGMEEEEFIEAREISEILFEDYKCLDVNDINEIVNDSEIDTKIIVEEILESKIQAINPNDNLIEQNEFKENDVGNFMISPIIDYLDYSNDEKDNSQSKQNSEKNINTSEEFKNSILQESFKFSENISKKSLKLTESKSSRVQIDYYKISDNTFPETENKPESFGEFVRTSAESYDHEFSDNSNRDLFQENEQYGINPFFEEIKFINKKSTSGKRKNKSRRKHGRGNRFATRHKAKEESFFFNPYLNI